MIKNSENIKAIIMKPTAITLCIIGQDWYQSKLTIIFKPNEYYPDYIEIERWIMDNIDGKELNIEHVTDQIYNYINEKYKPKELKIMNHVTGCKSHFEVTVIK